MSLAALLPALFFLVAPVAGAAGLVPCVGGDACRACDIVKLMQNVMEFLIYASALIAVLVLVMVGFKMIIGQADGGELGSAAMSIVIGIIIMLLAWLVVDTGLKMLVKDPSYGPWNQIQCVANPVPQEYAGNPSGVGGGITAGGPAGTGATGGPAGSNVDTVIKLADGREEVRSGGTIAWRNNNPGNMISGISGHPSIGRNGGFAVFPTYEAGFNAMIANLQTPMYQATTVAGALRYWAPGSDPRNDPAAYATFVQGVTGIPANTPMSTLSRDQLVQMGNAIQRMEGYRAGTVTTR